MTSDPRAYFVRLGGPTSGTFRATEHTGGGWATDEQHIAPMVGLVVHEIERHLGHDKVLSRLTVDILGVIGIEEFDVAVDVVRPGRTIELVEAVVTWAGRAVVRARAWRMTSGDTSAVEGGAPSPMPAPADTPVWDMSSLWPGGFIASLGVRRDHHVPGHAHVWVSTDHALVEGEQVSATAAFLSLVDTSNGVSVRESPQEWMYPNLDLSIHLLRQPEPGPTGLDTQVVFGPDGLGITQAVLHDVHGPVGRLSETLTVRRRG